MTTSTTRPPLNGVDTPTLFATLDAVKANPELAKFQFRAANRWINGTHNRSTIRSFYVAAARGVPLRAVKSTVEGDIDLLGILGLSDQVRNGYQGIRVSFEIEGDAPDNVLRDLVERSRARSAVYDVLTNGVPVSVDVTVG